MTTLLAFDTATERMTIALSSGGRLWSHAAPGGARASATLVPSIFALLREAGVGLADLDAIAFGRGPGAFTGLRTACSVAQGLAYGAGKPVLPLDSLLVVAEDVRSGATEFAVWVAIDARMDQIYAAAYSFAQGRWQARAAPFLSDAAALSSRWRAAAPRIVAGDALVVFGDRLETGDAQRLPAARGSAASLAALAVQAWHEGGAVDPAEALPLYVRDKVAATTIERRAAGAGR